MIGINAEQLPGKVGEVRDTFRKFAVRKIYRMSGFQRAVERTSMKNVPREKGKGNYSPRGTPPYTHPRISKAGNQMKAFPDFIQFKVEERGFNTKSVVGPTSPSKGKRSSWAERIGKTHEFGGTSTVEKRVYRQKDGQFRTPIDRIPLFGSGGGKLFPFRILFHKKPALTKKGVPRKGSKEWMLISYQATYPQRPFAAPALRKTIAATRQGKFG